MSDSREPPHNFEAEQVLLGSLLYRNEAYRAAGEILRPEHFADPLHGRLYSTMAGLADRAEPFNIVSLKPYVENDEDLKVIGASHYLARLLTMADMPDRVAGYAEQIRDLAQRRSLIDALGRAMDGAYAPAASKRAKDEIAQLDRDLQAIDEQSATKHDERWFREHLAEAIAEANAAYLQAGEINGVTTGLRALDELLGGLRPSDLIILAGRPAMGKTALATNIAMSAAAALKEGRDGIAAFYSLEMSGAQLTMRVLAEHAGVTASRIPRGAVSSFEIDRLLTIGHSMDPAIRIDTSPVLSITSLRSRAHRIKRQHGLGLIIVDYLQLLAGSSGKRDGRVQEIAEITRGLKILAKELDVPIVALSQLSRAVEQRDDKRPQLSDLRESGSIEQDADVVMFVYREEYYLSRAEPSRKGDESDEKFNARHDAWTNLLDQSRGKAEVIVAKHRHGPTGAVSLAFDASLTKFSDLADGDP